MSYDAFERALMLEWEKNGDRFLQGENDRDVYTKVYQKYGFIGVVTTVMSMMDTDKAAAAGLPFEDETIVTGVWCVMRHLGKPMHVSTIVVSVRNIRKVLEALQEAYFTYNTDAREMVKKMITEQVTNEYRKSDYIR